MDEAGDQGRDAERNDRQLADAVHGHVGCADSLRVTARPTDDRKNQKGGDRSEPPDRGGDVRRQ